MTREEWQILTRSVLGKYHHQAEECFGSSASVYLNLITSSLLLCQLLPSDFVTVSFHASSNVFNGKGNYSFNSKGHRDVFLGKGYETA